MEEGGTLFLNLLQTPGVKKEFLRYPEDANICFVLDVPEVLLKKASSFDVYAHLLCKQFLKDLRFEHEKTTITFNNDGLLISCSESQIRYPCNQSFALKPKKLIERSGGGTWFYSRFSSL